MSIKGTKTEQNLLKSFAGESQARSRYTFFASVAKKEGFEQIAGVFMETAEQEKEHAKRLFKMAPIHHHFEMCGWKEEKIVLVFASVTAAMCVLAWFGIAGLVG